MKNLVLSFSELVNELQSTKGCQFINLVSMTTPKMNKTNNPYYGRIQKVSTAQMQFGYDYERAVNNRLIKEGKEPNFTTEKLPYGKWLFKNKVIEHKGTFYIRTYSVKNSFPKVQYLLDGVEVSKDMLDDIKRYIKEDTSSSSKQDYFGLEDNQVKPKNYKFDNIISLTINKKVITLK